MQRLAQIESQPYNRRLAKKRFQCFNEVLCYVSSSMLADSLVLRNPLLRQARNRYKLKKQDNYQFGNFFTIFATNNNNVRVIAKRTLRDFWEKHADCEQQLKSWYRETEKSEWKNINDLKNEYPSASILKDNRIVYNIKGNKYRLIVKFNFEYGICWIRFIGTHAEYDKIDANNI